jgi:cellulose synthase/poly-beta-1,6-N-acetylglucosamine synthase-like glycosyltransferase
LDYNSKSLGKSLGLKQVAIIMNLIWLIFWIMLAFFSFGIFGLNYFLSRKSAKKPWRIRKDLAFLPEISIVIPTYNECEVIEYKLRNLNKLDYPRDLTQIVFVDSNSTDATVEKIRDFCAANQNINTEIILEKERRGKSAALNTALKNCVGEVVIVSDAVCFWSSGILAEALPYFSDFSVGAVSGPKKLLNTDDSWVTKTEARYLKSMNLVKLGESKASSTLLFEGGFAAFRRSAIDSFDPYNTGSDDCGTVIRTIQLGKRAIMVQGAEFYTFFPKNWKGKTDVKTRRALQLVRVLSKYLILLFKGNFKNTRELIFRNILQYLFAPILFFFFVATTFLVVVPFPLSLLLLSFFLIPKVNGYLFEAVLNYCIILCAICLLALGRKSTVWKKPRDRELIREEPLIAAGLI